MTFSIEEYIKDDVSDNEKESLPQRALTWLKSSFDYIPKEGTCLDEFACSEAFHDSQPDTLRASHVAPSRNCA